MADLPPAPPQKSRKTPQPISRRAFEEWIEHAPLTVEPGQFKPDHTLRNVIIAQACTVAIVTLTIVFSAGGIKQEISALTDWKKTVDEKISHMDSTGTMAGNASQHLIEQKNIEQDRRLNDMQADMSRIVPDLRELKTKLDDAIFLLQDGKNGKMTNR